ncbi:MAG: hypothetical protein ACE5F1_09685 [Planctomycetota bacterium]
MAFRIAMLLLVTFLGSIVYYSRKESEPLPLLKVAFRRTLILFFWAAVTLGIFTAVEAIWIH